MYAPACWIQRLAELKTPGTGRREAGGVWRAVFGGQRVAGRWRCMLAQIMTLVDIIVRTLCLAIPPRQDLKMPHTHGVEICSLRFRRKGRQLDLGESRSPTQIFQWHLVPASHRLWAYVCTFGLGLMGMIAMVMMLAIAIIVLEVLIQVGWLRQHQHQSFHSPRAFY